VAIIGCVVNGPGEAKEVDVGLTGGSPNNLIYIDGKPAEKLKNENLIDGLEAMVRESVAKKQRALKDVIVSDS
jgi:(E)-4-hydroxy-3-methylbut-2-enyl-diphosphate synthase